jgi:intein-encoded DNA endonuclease-like protein
MTDAERSEQIRKDRATAALLKGRVKTLSINSKYGRKEYVVTVSGPIDYSKNDLINWCDGGYSPFGGSADKTKTTPELTEWKVAVYID